MASFGGNLGLKWTLGFSRVRVAHRNLVLYFAYDIK